MIPRNRRTGLPMVADPNLNEGCWLAVATLIREARRHGEKVAVCILAVGDDVGGGEEHFVYAPPEVWACDTLPQDELVEIGLLGTIHKLAEIALPTDFESDGAVELEDAIGIYERTNNRYYWTAVIVQRETLLARYSLNGVPVSRTHNPEKYFVELLDRHLARGLSMPPIPGSESDHD